MVVIITLLVILITTILPSIVQQTMVFTREFSEYSQRFMRALNELEVYLSDLGLDSRIADQLDRMLSQFFVMIGDYVRDLVSAIVGYIFKFTDFVIIVILLFYFLMDGTSMVRFFIDHVPESLREAAENFFNGIDSIIWGYMKIQVLYSVIFGAASSIAYILLKLPFSGLLGIIAMCLNMIPYIGSIISGTIAFFVALLFFDFNKALLTLFIILMLNVVLGSIMTPFLQGKTLKIHPALVIVSLLVGNYLWGPIGMLIAVPLLGFARLLLKEVVNVINNL
jgi:predicted PurR-regulated permease PerM